MSHNFLHSAAVSALLLASPLELHAQEQPRTELISPSNIADVVSTHTNALRVFNHSAVHRTPEGRSEIPFEIYQQVATNYVFSADLARALIDSSYILKADDKGGYNLTSETGLSAHMEVLDEYLTTNMMRNIYFFDGESKKTFKGKFEALMALTITREEDGRIGYKAEYWARPKGGRIKQFFADLMIKLFSLQDDIDERVLDITRLAEETTEKILYDPDKTLRGLINNSQGIEFDKSKLYELKRIIDNYTRGINYINTK